MMCYVSDSKKFSSQTQMRCKDKGTPFVRRFGMVTMETDVEELLSLVINTGRDIDEAVVQLQTMSEVVRKGVQQAQDELKKEAENQLWQEGILR